MNLQRLNGNDKKIVNHTPLKIRFDWQIIAPPIVIVLANIYLIWPLLTNFPATIDWRRLIFPLAYIFGPVGLYFYVWEISRRRLTSLLAALIYTLPAIRLTEAINFGDQAHVIALSILPLSLICFLRYLRNPTLVLITITAFSMAAIAIISPLTLFTLLIFIMTITYSEMLLGQGRFKLILALIVLILAAGLSAFWYHPEFLIDLFKSDRGRALISIIWDLFPLSFVILPVIGAFTFLIFDRRPLWQPIFLAGSQSFVFLLIYWVGNNISSLYVPEPAHFLPELIFTLSFFLAQIITTLFKVLTLDFIRQKIKIPDRQFLLIINQVLPGLVLILFTVLIIMARTNYWDLIGGEWAAPIIYRHYGGISTIVGRAISLFTIVILGIIWFNYRIKRQNV